MKRLYLLAAAVSVTGGMAFSAPQEDAPEKEAAVLDVQTPPSGKQDQPAIPERLLDDSHMNEELGINEFTAPSIRKIFEDLEGLPEIPEKVALRARPERPPMDRCSLALQLGGMMADGFVIVQCGKMNEVKPIALDLSSYAKAIGAGERNYDSTGARAALSNSSVVLRMASTPALSGLASGASVICSCKTVRRFMILAMSRRSFISGSTPSRI